jgi:hypothetical protein
MSSLSHCLCDASLRLASSQATVDDITYGMNLLTKKTTIYKKVIPLTTRRLSIICFGVARLFHSIYCFTAWKTSFNIVYCLIPTRAGAWKRFQPLVSIQWSEMDRFHQLVLQTSSLCLSTKCIQ